MCDRTHLKRKRKPSRSGKDDLETALQGLCSTSIVCAIVRKNDVLGALFRIHEDPSAVHLVKATALLLQKAFESEPGKGPLCLRCDTEFNKTIAPADFWIVYPYLIDWSNAAGQPYLVTGICDQCSQQDDHELKAVGIRQMKRIWPDSNRCPKGPHDDSAGDTRND